MCRARPGPRCSNSGQKRVQAARKNVARHEKNVRDFQENNPNQDVPQDLTQKVSDAHLRLAAANNVFYATPEGQKEIALEIEGLRKQLSKTPEGLSGDDLKKDNELRREIKTKEATLNSGIERRLNSYEDYHEFKDERPVTRQESINRGSDLNPQAQRNRSGKDFTTGDPQPVELRDFSETALQRADSWVEEGATTIPFDNTHARPAKKIDGVEIGSKEADAKTFLSRMSLPDGSIVEARHDHHITKNDEGKHVLSIRTTIATSFEDASPIDKTQHELGHLLKNDRGKTFDTIIGEYDSLAGAKTRRGMVMNQSKNRGANERYDYARVTAENARALTQYRFGQVKSSSGADMDVQKRGLNTVQSRRYSRVDENELTKYEEKRAEKLAKARKRAFEAATQDG